MYWVHPFNIFDMNLKNVATVKKKASSTKLVTNLNHYKEKSDGRPEQSVFP